MDHVRDLQREYNDLIPVPALRVGFRFAGRRISLGSFYSGIFRPKEMSGPAALCVVTAPPNQILHPGTPVNLTVTASDPDNDAIASIAASNLPPGVTMTPQGVISGAPNTVGTYVTTLTARDQWNVSSAATPAR